jgi:Gpi18-like mannosyltransferase
MNILDDRLKKAGILALFAIALFLRYLSLPAINLDLRIHNIPWYETIIDLGILRALGTNFSNYSPPYTYLLAFSTLAHKYLSPVVSIKLIPIFFDLLTAIFIYRIVKLKYPAGVLPFLASAVYFIAPTVVINSSYWGQADSIYTSFLVMCLYYLLQKKPTPALFAFAASLAIKAQAVFFIPLLVVLVLKKRIPIWTFGLVPIVYLLAILPVVILGRPPLDALFIYINQAGSYDRLSMKAPNLYSFMPESWYVPGLIMGTVLTIIFLVLWIRHTSHTQSISGRSWIVLTALISVALTPFLLPKMHDRYFYPADVFSILLAFYSPGLWFIPIAYQTISLLAYTNFFSDATLPTIYLAAILNTITMAFLLRRQLNEQEPVRIPKLISSSFSWFTALLLPVILIGAVVRLLITPTFLKFEYSRSNFPHDEFGFTTTERLTWAPYVFNFLYNKKEIKFLNKIRLEDGSQVFNDQERLHMLVAKELTQKFLNAWYLALLCLPLIGVIAWVCNWFPTFLVGIQRAGLIALGVGILMLIPVLLIFPVFFDYVNTLLFGGASLIINPEDAFSRLFPIHFWKDMFLILSLAMVFAGLALAASGKQLNTNKNQSLNP